MNSLASDPFRIILIHLPIFQVLQLRRCCKSWRDTINTFQNLFETLYIIPDPVVFPFLPRHMHVGDKFTCKLPMPFMNYTKRLKIDHSPDAILHFLENHEEMIPRLESIEMTMRIHKCMKLQSIFNLCASRFTSVRLIFYCSLTGSHIIHDLCTYLPKTCKISIVAFSRIFNTDVDKSHCAAENFVGLISEDCIYPWYNVRLYGEKRVEEIGIHISKLDIPSVILQSGIFSDTVDLSELDILHKHSQWSSIRSLAIKITTMTEIGSSRLEKILDTSTSIESLELDWSYTFGHEISAPVRFKSINQRITSLTLKMPRYLKSFQDVVDIMQFPRLRSLILHVNDNPIISIENLLASMPVLYNLEINTFPLIDDYVIIERICEATVAKIIRFNTVNTPLVIVLNHMALNIWKDNSRSIFDGFGFSDYSVILMRRFTGISTEYGRNLTLRVTDETYPICQKRKVLDNKTF